MGCWSQVAFKSSITGVNSKASRSIGDEGDDEEKMEVAWFIAPPNLKPRLPHPKVGDHHHEPALDVTGTKKAVCIGMR